MRDATGPMRRFASGVTSWKVTTLRKVSALSPPV
jgi:hypothetical protein